MGIARFGDSRNLVGESKVSSKNIKDEAKVANREGGVK